MANPFELEFEELLPFYTVSGPGAIDPRCIVFEGPAPFPFPANPATPSSSIRTDQNWGVAFQWETHGALNFIMAGSWNLTVYLEQMGGGEFSLPNNEKSVPFVSAPTTYGETLTFPAGTVPEGAYRLVTTVDFDGPTGFQGPINAVGEGPVVRFYNVGP